MKRITTAHFAVNTGSTIATMTYQDPYCRLVLLYWFRVHKVSAIKAITKARSSQQSGLNFLTTHFLDFSKDNYP